MAAEEKDAPRVTRRDGWTAARRAAFLDQVAASCNISRSARAVGMHPLAPYALKRRDAEFAAQWEEALKVGYERLEQELLTRAFGGSDDAVDETSGPAATFDPDLIKWLIGRHEAGQRNAVRPGGRPARPVSIAELVETLDKRIAAIARRRRKK